MSATVSPSADKKYAVAQICEVWGVPRSTYYHWLSSRKPDAEPPQKRGPQTGLSDADLLAKIKEQLDRAEKELGIRGEGYRKVFARLRHAGVRTSRRRVLRIMRENALLAPTRQGKPRGPRNHDGVIRTERPNEMWGTDATCIPLRTGMLVWVFIAVDHCTSECVGVHASISGSRFEALEPVRQGVRELIGSPDAGVADGLALRHDHGSQYMSAVFQQEIKFLGIRSSPSFVASPEGNGIAERFIRLVKEQLLWVESFETVDELREALQAWRERYNASWLVARHGYRTPNRVRHDLLHAREPEGIAA
jgi:putative transposase